MKGFTVPAIMTRISSTADRGLSVAFHTKELPTEEKIGVMEFHNLSGWLLFQPNEIQETEIPAQQAEVNIKTPSQRLRNTLFVYWRQQGIKEDFDTFYKSAMEKIINEWKAELL